MKRLAR